MFDYIIVQSDGEYAIAARLFEEYAAWLKIDLSFQKFDEELTVLKAMYAAPDGGIILCKTGNEFIGCVAIRKINNSTAELKRMFVHTAFQGKGIGKILLEKAIELADNAGYLSIRLDTLNYMLPAINLYKKYGFYEIPAYYHNPNETAVYFELQITRS